MNTHIVIVNHSVELGAVFRQILASRGYSVTLYSTWARALPAMRDDPPALVVLDKHIADGEPQRMGEQIKPLDAAPPVLMWGLEWTPDEMRQLAGSGIAGFLSGAISAETLTARVRHALKGFENRKIA